MRKRRCKEQEATAPHRIRFRKTVTKEVSTNILAYVKKFRQSRPTLDEKLCILAVHRAVREAYELRKKKNPKMKKQDLNMLVAARVGRSKRIASRVWQEYNSTGQLTSGAMGGNTKHKHTRVPRTKHVMEKVVNFVRAERSEGRRVVARNVVGMLEQENMLSLDRSNATSVAAAERNVRRYLVDMGFQRGHRAGFDCRLKNKIAVLRDSYLLTLQSNRDNCAGQRRRIVYMDESYIHEHYTNHDDSLFYPHDPHPYVKKKRFKGRRYCFVGAILGPDTNVSEGSRCESERASFMMEMLDIFVGGNTKKSDVMSARSIFPGLGIHKKKRDTKDYHAMFNHDYFVQWMTRLLEALKDRNVRNCIITMDNAKYHRVFPPDVPVSNSRKQVYFDFARKHGCDVPDDISCVTLALLKEKIQGIPRETVVQRMARQAGHEVMYTPPYHSDLQPIETIWAIVKTSVGRQHEYGTSMKETLKRTVAAFKGLTSKQVQGCIAKAITCENDFLKQIKEAENQKSHELGSSDELPSSCESESDDV